MSPAAYLQLAAAGMAFAAALLVAATVRLLRTGSRRYSSRLAHLGGVELAELFIFTDRTRFALWNALALLLLPGTAFLLTGSFTAVLAVTGIVLAAPAWLYRRLKLQRRAALQRQFPDCACALASGLRAGLALGQALEQIPRYQPRPAAQEIALVLREHRLGVPLDEALAGLAQRSGLHDFSMLVATLGIARDIGGGLAEALERLAGSARRRLAMEERILALTAQGRLQGLIMGLLPLGLGLVLFLLEPEAMAQLFVSPAGWAVLAVIAVLELSGWLMIRRIVSVRV